MGAGWAPFLGLGASNQSQSVATREGKFSAPASALLFSVPLD